MKKKMSQTVHAIINTYVLDGIESVANIVPLH